MNLSKEINVADVGVQTATMIRCKCCRYILC